MQGFRYRKTPARLPPPAWHQLPAYFSGIMHTRWQVHREGEDSTKQREYYGIPRTGGDTSCTVYATAGQGITSAHSALFFFFFPVVTHAFCARCREPAAHWLGRTGATPMMC